MPTVYSTGFETDDPTLSLAGSANRYNFPGPYFPDGDWALNIIQLKSGLGDDGGSMAKALTVTANRKYTIGLSAMSTIGSGVMPDLHVAVRETGAPGYLAEFTLDGDTFRDEFGTTFTPWTSEEFLVPAGVTEITLEINGFVPLVAGGCQWFIDIVRLDQLLVDADGLWTKVVVGPRTFKAQLDAIGDDGQDYDIVLSPGTYYFGFDGLNQYQAIKRVPKGDWIWSRYSGQDQTYYLLDHRSGGRIRLRTLLGPGSVVFRAVTPVGAPAAALTICARHIEVDGLVLDYPPYQDEAFEANEDWPKQNVKHPHGEVRLNLGGGFVPGSGLTRVCDPTHISLTNCTLRGRANVRIIPSQSSLVYTDVRVTDVKYEEIEGSAVWFRGAQILSPVYLNMTVTRLDGNGRNGPDGSAWSGGSFLTSLHNDGTLGLEAYDMGGSSTLEVVDCQMASYLEGSINHDMHCFRVNFMLSSTAKVTFRDCFFRGEWRQRHHSGNGGGNLWLGYYHGNNIQYPGGEGARPLFTFESCTFSGYISPAVTEDPGELNGDPGLPYRYLFFANASADYEFWDCAFSWDMPAQFYNGYVWDARIGTGTHGAVWLHNCTRATGANHPGLWPVGPVYDAGAVYIDNQTRGWKSIHRRPAWRGV